MKYDASQQTLGWFKERYLEGNLEIRPPYQRRPVWSVRQKSNLIESILLKLPVPEIYIHTETSADGKTTYAVVDGQQRVRSILQFIGIDKDATEVEDNGFALEDLSGDSKWRNVSYEDLTVQQKQQFFGHQMAVRTLSDATDDEIRDLFRRLNRYLTKLNDQELRNATYSGPLVQLVEELADDDFWAENGVMTAALIRRMKDMEFVSELIFGIMDGPQSGTAKTIDEYYLQMEQYSEEFPKQKTVKRMFVRTLNLIKELYPDMRKTRWKNRTDFYSLFVVFAELLNGHILPTTQHAPLKRVLATFTENVDKRIADETARVPPLAADYARSAVRGVSDRSRRAVRHDALMETVFKFFKESTKAKI